MRWRRARGFSLVEMLASLALIGLSCAAIGALSATTWREAAAAREATDHFESQWLAMTRLRADVQRASTVDLRPRVLHLTTPEGKVDWVVFTDVIERRSTTTRRFEIDRTLVFELKGRPGRRVVRWQPLGHAEGPSGSARVGSRLGIGGAS
ncbi:MAG: prepilin-type N-terminal cleavage/methylation domain-containing protein [Acidobacteriota bacterium]